MWIQVEDNIYVDIANDFMSDDITHLVMYINNNTRKYKSERYVVIIGAVLLTIVSFVFTLSNNPYIFGGAFIVAVLALFSMLCAYTTKISRFICVSIPSSDYYDVDVYGFSYYVHVKKTSKLMFTYIVPIDIAENNIQVRSA